MKDTHGKVIGMYSGQGSQYYAMGADLYAGNAGFRRHMHLLDDAVNDYGGFSVVDLLYDQGKKYGDPFNRTLHTHPALFVTGYALSQVLLENGLVPDYLLGASLGEYIALAVAGCCQPADMVKALIESARLLEARGAEGGMTAVLAGKELLDLVPEAFAGCSLASDNFSAHFVVSGCVPDLERAERYLAKENVTFKRLPVSTAFHSPVMDGAEKEIKAVLGRMSIRQASLPLVSCARQAINPPVDADYLWDVARTPVRFRQTIAMLEQRGDFAYVDLGPSGTLSGFVAKCLDTPRKSHSILTPFGNNENKIKQLAAVFRAPGRATSISIQKDMHTTKAFIFPGQGSQKKGMGGALFGEFEELVGKADQVLGYSVQELCLADPGEQLVQTQYAQVALYVVNALHYYKKYQSGERPDFVAGHSLGEYNALLAAGAFDFETGLRLVQKRGQIMAKAKGGGMAAIIGMDDHAVQAVIETHRLTALDVANYNSPYQIVISGPRDEVMKAQPYFEKAGAQLFIPLKVSGAFHSRGMQEGALEFSDFLAGFAFNPLQIPVVSNVSARPYPENSIRENLTRQIASPVKWTESVRYLMGRGVGEFVELGEGNVLKGLVNKIKKEATPLVVPDDQAAVPEYPKRIPIKVVGEKAAPTAPAGPLPDGAPARESNPPPAAKQLGATALGSAAYRKAYGVTYAYAAGAMHRGIASVEMVVALSRAGLMSYFGSAGLPLHQVEEAIKRIQGALGPEAPFGANLVYDLFRPEDEKKMIELYLGYGIRYLDVSGYLQVTAPLVKFRAKGLDQNAAGEITSAHRIQVKLARPEVAELFLSPAPEHLVQALLTGNEISPRQAEWLRQVPLATEVCTEADPAGPTEKGAVTVLLPTIRRLKNQLAARYGYREPVNLGAAGGIGTPEAAAAAFLLGADYIVTGSINQCTVESGASASVKNLLESINIQDTDYAPAKDMFEWGAKVQVLKKGVFFPARANKLFDVYQQFDSLEALDAALKDRLEQKYFKKTFEQIFQACRQLYPQPELRKAEENPKTRMALVFKWYLDLGTGSALAGDESNKVNYQVYCSPALGAFNQWVKGTHLEKWQNRNVAPIAIKLLDETAGFLAERLAAMHSA